MPALGVKEIYGGTAIALSGGMSLNQFDTPARPNEPQDLRPGFRLTKLVRQERRQFKIEAWNAGTGRGASANCGRY
jgi:hypothetical protein